MANGKKNEKKKSKPSIKAMVRKAATDSADIAVYAALGTMSVMSVNEGSEGSGTIVEAIKTKDLNNVSAAVKDSSMNAPRKWETYAAKVGIPLYDGAGRMLKRIFRR